MPQVSVNEEEWNHIKELRTITTEHKRAIIAAVQVLAASCNANLAALPVNVHKFAPRAASKSD
jgi:hypothetical protein